MLSPVENLAVPGAVVEGLGLGRVLDGFQQETKRSLRGLHLAKEPRGALDGVEDNVGESKLVGEGVVHLDAQNLGKKNREGLVRWQCGDMRLKKSPWSGNAWSAA